MTTDKTLRLVRIGEAAKRLGVTPQALRKWEESGELVPARRTRGGTRYYALEDLVEAKSVESEPLHDPMAAVREKIADGIPPHMVARELGLTEDETAEAEREYDRHLVGLLHEHAKSNWRAAAYLLEHQAKGETVTARGRLPLPPKLVVCRPKNQDTQSTDGDSQ